MIIQINNKKINHLISTIFFYIFEFSFTNKYILLQTIENMQIILKNWNWDFSELFLKNKYIFLQNIEKMIF